MKKVLLFIGATLASFSLSFSQAPQQETFQKKSDSSTSLRSGVKLPSGFTYADRDNAAAGKTDVIGIGDAGVYVAGGIELPVAAGVKIKGISYLCESDDAYGKVFIASRASSGSVGEYTILQVAQGKTKKGALTKVDFKTPVTTKADKAYIIGYEAKQTVSNGYIISFVSDLHMIPKSSFLAFNDKASLVGSAGSKLEMTDVSGRCLGSLALVVHYDDPQGNYDCLVMVNTPFSPTVRKIGTTISAEDAKFLVQIRNLGSKAISKLTFQVKKPDGSSEDKEYPATIAAESNGKVIYEAGEITAPPAKGSFALVLKGINGAANGITDAPLLKTVLPYQLYPEGSVLRYKLLVECFTGEGCGNCPPADKRMQEAYKKAYSGKGLSVVVAAHHVGYYDKDFLTLDQSKELLRYFLEPVPIDYSYAPAFVISRLNDIAIKQVIGAQDPGMYMGVSSAAHILQQLEIAHQIPSEGRILRIEQKDTNDSVRSITITGKMADPAAKDDVYLSIYRTEDGVPAVKQAGAPKEFKHDNAVREFVTPTFGRKVTVDDKGDFTITIKNVKVSKDWSNESMHFVVFIHRDIKNKDLEMRYVYSAESIGVHSMTGNREVAPELQPVAYAIEGRILINGAFDSFLVYDVSGRIVSTSSDTILPAGLYIVKSRLGDLDYISKVLVN